MRVATHGKDAIECVLVNVFQVRTRAESASKRLALAEKELEAHRKGALDEKVGPLPTCVLEYLHNITINIIDHVVIQLYMYIKSGSDEADGLVANSTIWFSSGPVCENSTV